MPSSSTASSGGNDRKKQKGKGKNQKKNQKNVKRKQNFIKHRLKQKGNNQQQKRLWIESVRCKSSKNIDSLDADVKVIITRVELDEESNHMIPATTVSNQPEPCDDDKDNVSKRKHDGDDGTSKKVCHDEKETQADTQSDCQTDPKCDVDDPDEGESPQSPEKINTDDVQIRKNSIVVTRSPNAQGKTKWALQQQQQNKSNKNHNFTHLPNGDCGDGVVNPYQKSKVPDKFWAQRRRLFQRFEEGIQLDSESWYSVTPEVIANHIAMRTVQLCLQKRINNSTGCIIIDAFCGCGGNAIAFAKRPKHEISLVIAIDTDRLKLRMAANNARVYEIPPDKIIFIHADTIDIMKLYSGGKLICTNEHATSENDSEKNNVTESDAAEVCCGFQIGGKNFLPPFIDSIFLSPPWGGIDYLSVGPCGYDIQKNIQIPTNVSLEGENQDHTLIDGKMLLQIALEASRDHNVLYFLPRNINGISLGRYASNGGYHGIFEMEQNVINGKVKTVTSYFSQSYTISSSA